MIGMTNSTSSNKQLPLVSKTENLLFVYLVGKHLMQHPHNLRAGRVPDKMHRVVLVPHRIVPCTKIRTAISHVRTNGK